MPRRRVERNISYDEERKLYYVNLDYGPDPQTGKQVKASRTFIKIRQARSALRKHELARESGRVVKPRELTLEEWLTTWMNDVISLSRAVTTVYAYQNIIHSHIIPALGAQPIQKITPQQLQAYYAALIRDKHLSSNTARKHHDLLNAAFKAAVKQGILLSNPAERVEAPKPHPPEIHYYSMENLQRLLTLSKGTRIEVLVKLAALLGLRREEILGLTWNHVNFHSHKLEVANVRTAAGKTVVTKEPKTATSKRTLYMPPDLEDALKREAQKQARFKAYLGSSYQDDGYVFTYEDGRPMRPNYASDLFTKFIHDNDLPPITLHGLRHSFASIANAKGIPMYDIGKALGHSSPATTSKIYTHLMDPDHKNLLERMWESLSFPEEAQK